MVVLVVDDEPLAREIVSEGLKDDGFTVAEAPTAEEALRLADHTEAPEAIVTDVRLGDGMDGFRLAEEARRRWPGAGVVIMTGQPAALDGRRLGSRDGVLVKPFDYSTLVRAVRHSMGHSER